MIVGIHGTLDTDAHIGDTMTNVSSIAELSQFYANQSNDSDDAVATVINSDLFITVTPIGPAPMYDTDPMAWLITM